MDLQVFKIQCSSKSVLQETCLCDHVPKFLSVLFRTCKRVDLEELSKEEMVEIEGELKRRKELLERKCHQLEQSLPKPKKGLSHLR